jgi:hypothetical protein
VNPNVKRPTICKAVPKKKRPRLCIIGIANKETLRLKEHVAKKPKFKPSKRKQE